MEQGIFANPLTTRQMAFAQMDINASGIWRFATIFCGPENFRDYNSR
jgi:hypothetical protein